MKHIISVFTSLFILVVNIIAVTAMITLSGDVAAAKEYKADVIAEIENSNFNSNVINSCIAQAGQAGYTLQVTNCTYDDLNNVQTAEVILSYSYQIPLFGIVDTKTTRGIAR